MGDDLNRLNAASAPESIQWQQRDESAELIAVPATQEQAKRIKDIAQDLGFTVQVEDPRAVGENFRIIAVRSPTTLSHMSHTDAASLKPVQELKAETLANRNERTFQELAPEMKKENQRALPGDFHVVQKSPNTYEIVIRTDNLAFSGNPIHQTIPVMQDEVLADKIEEAKKNQFLSSPIRTKGEQLREQIKGVQKECLAGNENEARERLKTGSNDFCIWPSHSESFGYGFVVKSFDEDASKKKFLVYPGINLLNTVSSKSSSPKHEIEFQLTGRTDSVSAAKLIVLQQAFPADVKYPNVPKDIKIDENTKRPVFDEKWEDLTHKFMGRQSLAQDHKYYLENAQTLLDRLFAKVPKLAEESNKGMYPNLMMMALHLALKTDEDLAIWNSDIVEHLARPPTALLNKMERAFLGSIDYEMETKRDPNIEMKEFLLAETLPPIELRSILMKHPMGTYIIQKEGDHYILAIKSKVVKEGKETTDVVLHRFSLDKIGRPDRKLENGEIAQPKIVDAEGKEKTADLPPKQKIKNDYETFGSLQDDVLAKTLLTDKDGEIRFVNQLMKKSIPDAKINDLLSEQPEGVYMLKREEDHYVMAVKSLHDKEEKVIFYPFYVNESEEIIFKNDNREFLPYTLDHSGKPQSLNIQLNKYKDILEFRKESHAQASSTLVY